ncbi:MULTISPECIES: hypothetical protein [Persicobacter]|nr:hypothetical protein [Persicobacter sp. CCB-QB2]
MKKLNYSILLSVSLIFLVGIMAMNPKKKKENPLMGSWEMSSFKYGADPDFSELPQMMKYVKHITEDHFTWVSYSPNDGNVVGTGGGTYDLTDDFYTEHIDFFQPSGSKLAGTSVKFKYTVKGNEWRISGYVHNVQMDPNSGKYVVVDSTLLEEIWHRL